MKTNQKKLHRTANLINQMELFNQNESSENSPEDNNPSLGYLLTNRNNLLDILSSGIMKPANGYSKYYEDAGSHCDKFLPIFLVKPDIEFMRNINSEDENIFPVLIEVNLDLINGNCFSVNPDYSYTEIMVQDHQKTICLLINGALPLSIVSEIQFRSQFEKDEFEMHHYENVPLNQKIKKTLLNSKKECQIEKNQIVKSFELINQKIEGIPKEKYVILDKLGGAITILAKFWQQVPIYKIDTLIEFLTAISVPITNRFIGKNNNLAHFLNETDKKINFSGNARISLASKITSENPDQLLLCVIVSHILDYTTISFSGEVFINIVRRDFFECLCDLSIQSDYERIFNVIDLVMINELSLEEGLNQIGNNYQNSQLLLLFIIHSDINGATNCYMKYSWLDIEIFSFMSILAGTLIGRSRIPVTYYPGQQMIERIDNMLCQRLNSTTGLSVLVNCHDDFILKKKQINGVKNEVLCDTSGILISRIAAIKKK